MTLPYWHHVVVLSTPLASYNVTCMLPHSRNTRSAFGPAYMISFGMMLQVSACRKDSTDLRDSNHKSVCAQRALDLTSRATRSSHGTVFLLGTY
jgi:hypothetical protein